MEKREVYGLVLFLALAVVAIWAAIDNIKNTDTIAMQKIAINNQMEQIERQDANLIAKQEEFEKHMMQCLKEQAALDSALFVAENAKPDTVIVKIPATSFQKWIYVPEQDTMVLRNFSVKEELRKSIRKARCDKLLADEKISCDKE